MINSDCFNLWYPLNRGEKSATPVQPAAPCPFENVDQHSPGPDATSATCCPCMHATCDIEAIANFNTL